MIPRSLVSSRLRYTPGGGGAGRSSSILAALLRLRQQYQRAGGNASGGAHAHRSGARTTASSMTSTAAPSSSDLVWREALRLLSADTRAADSLSDVPRSSPQYGAEVGKLLAVAATFGATTSLGRVKEVLDWILQHPHQLTTTRQVMSIATPLLNLKDGAIAGRLFIVETLLPLLLTALAQEGSVGDGSGASLTDTMLDVQQDSADRQRQSAVAVTSVFQLLPKLLASSANARGDEAQTEQQKKASSSQFVAATLLPCVSVFEAATAALQRLCDGGVSLEIADCAHLLEAYLALEQTLQSVRLNAGSERADHETRLNDAWQTHALPVLTSFLSHDDASKDRSALASPAATTASLRATAADVVRLLQALLALNQRASAHSSTSSAQPLLACALTLLPGTLSAASAREMANATTVVTRIRQAYPSLVSEQQALGHTLEAMRSKLFQLAGAHQNQIGALECSVLLSNVSKWAVWDATLTVPDDVVEMLFARMAAQMRFAHAPQLVPLFESFARFRRYYCRQDGSGDRVRLGANATNTTTCAAFFRRIPAAELALRDAHNRALQLWRDGEKLSVADIAHVLTSLADLHSADSLAADFYCAVEPALTSVCSGQENDGDALAPPSATTTQPATTSHAHTRTIVLQALDALLLDMGSADALDASVRAVHTRATALRERLLHDAMRHASTASSPKELVMLFRSLSAIPRGATSGQCVQQDHIDKATEADTWAEEDLQDSGADVDGVVAHTDGETLPSWNPFLATTAHLAPDCNAFEVSMLMRAVVSLHKAPQCSGGAHHWSAMAALLERSSQPSLQWTIIDAKRFMDAARSAGVAQQLPATVLTAMADALTAEGLKAGAAGSTASGDQVAQLTFVAQTGRTLLSLLRRLGDGAGVPHAAVIALLRCCSAYAQWCEAVVDAALNTTHQQAVAGDVLGQLCLISFSLGHLKRLGVAGPSGRESAADQKAHEPAGYGDEDNANDGIDDEDGDNRGPADAADRADVLAGAKETLGQHVDEALLSIGDAVQLLLLRSASWPDVTDPDTEGDAVREDPRHDAAMVCLVRPKGLIMLLQAYEAADLRHPTLFDDLMPSILVAADAMGVLELSLLLTCLTHLGAWNGRVVRHLAERAKSKLVQPPAGDLEATRAALRHATSLLRTLQQSRSLPPSTFLCPSARQVTREDWHCPATTSSSTPSTALGSPQSALTVLAQTAVDTLDALVCTKAGMETVLTAATFDDLAQVVRVCTSALTTPPQPTTDAYIVLSVKKLVQNRGGPQAETLSAALALFPCLNVLRRYDHRVASTRTIATVLSTLTQGTALLDAHSTQSLVRLVSAHAAAELFYGEAVLSAGGSLGTLGDVVAMLQHKLAAAMATLSPSTGILPPTHLVRQAERCLENLPVSYFASAVPALLTPFVAHVAASLPSVTALAEDRSARASLCALVRMMNMALLSGTHTIAPLPSTWLVDTNSTLLVWLQSVFPPSLSSQAIHLSLARFSPRELAVLWQSLALVSRSGGDGGLLARVLPPLQERLHAKESQLQLPHAVDLFLGAAQFFLSEPREHERDVFGSLPTATQDAVLSVAHLGAAVYIRTLHTVEPTGLPKLYESYRLLLGDDACFLRWLAVLKATTHAAHGATLHTRCDLVKSLTQVLTWGASCLYVADQGGARQVKLSPKAMACVKRALRDGLSPTH